MYSERKTTVTLTPLTQQSYDLAKADNDGLTLSDFINACVKECHDKTLAPLFDVAPLMAQLQVIRHRLDTPAEPTPAQISRAELEALFAKQTQELRGLISESTRPKAPPHVPKWRQWFRKTRVKQSPNRW